MSLGLLGMWLYLAFGYGMRRRPATLVAIAIALTVGASLIDAHSYFTLLEME